MAGTVQSNIEDLLHKAEGSTLKKVSPLGLPKLADALISSVLIITTKDGLGRGFSVDLSWAGRAALNGVPGAKIKDNPLIVSVFRTTGGGLILRSKQLNYKDQDIEVIIHGNVYKIKGMTVSYSF